MLEDIVMNRRGFLGKLGKIVGIGAIAGQSVFGTAPSRDIIGESVRVEQREQIALNEEIKEDVIQIVDDLKKLLDDAKDIGARTEHRMEVAIDLYEKEKDVKKRYNTATNGRDGRSQTLRQEHDLKFYQLLKDFTEEDINQAIKDSKNISTRADHFIQIAEDILRKEKDIEKRYNIATNGRDGRSQTLRQEIDLEFYKHLDTHELELIKFVYEDTKRMHTRIEFRKKALIKILEVVEQKYKN